MAAVALVKFTQGPHTAAGGIAVVGTLSDGVLNIANDVNTDVVSWSIDLLDVPPGSVLVPGVLNSATSNTPNATLTPDTQGPYRVRLTVSGTAGEVDVDIRVFVVPTVKKRYLLPPYQKLPDPLPVTGEGIVGEKPNETNYGGQTRGHAGDADPTRGQLHRIFSDVDALEGLPSKAGKSTGEALQVEERLFFDAGEVASNDRDAFVLGTNFTGSGGSGTLPWITSVSPDDNEAFDFLEVGVATDILLPWAYDGARYIWMGVTASGTFNGFVRRYDPATNTIGAATSVSTGTGALSMAFGGGYVWLGHIAGVQRVDPDTPASQVTVTGLGAISLSTVLYDADTSHYGDTLPRVWVSNNTLPGVQRIETTTPAYDAGLTLTGAVITAISLGAGFLWALYEDTGSGGTATLSRIIYDPISISASSTDINTTFDTTGAGGIHHMLYDAGTSHVYILGRAAGGAIEVAKVDPATLLVSSTLVLDAAGFVSTDPLFRMSVFKGHLWITLRDSSGVSHVLRVDPATMLLVQELDTYRSTSFTPLKDVDVLVPILTVSTTTATTSAEDTVVAVETATIGAASLVSITRPKNIGTTVWIYDSEGGAGTDLINVAATGSDTFNGKTDLYINTDYGVIGVTWLGGTEWAIRAGSTGVQGEREVVPVFAGESSTDLTGYVRLASFQLQGTDFLDGTFTLDATLETTSPDCDVRLFNVTDAVVVGADPLLTTTSTAPVNLSVAVTPHADSKLYELQIKMRSGSAPEFVTCSGASLNILYDNY